MKVGLKAAATGGAVAITLAATIVGATSVGAVMPNTHSYSTQSQCDSAVSAAKKSGKSITQNCTYAGGYFLWMQTDSGPWIAVF